MSLTTTDPMAAFPMYAAETIDRLDDLAGLLHAAVAAGASVNFIHPFSLNAARAYWLQAVHPAQIAGTRLLFGWAEAAGEAIVGTAQLDLIATPNQRHRAEVMKLIVHPDYRRRGIARRLMAAVEAAAEERGRSLLTLDTRTGDAAEPLYRSLGFTEVERIPGYCLSPEGGRLDGTTLFYKTLQ